MQHEAAIITGAASGIGKATAMRLALSGRPVLLVDRDGDGLDQAQKAITAQSGDARVLVGDVGSEHLAQEAVEVCAGLWGVPGALVNCAGILRLAPALEVDLAAFRNVISANLDGTFLFCVSAARAAVAAGTPLAIVNVSSVHAAISEPNAVAYTASKGGIEAMSRTFASEWAEHDIRVNLVRPGAIWTGMSTPIYSEEVLSALSRRIPMRKPGAPEQVAGTILFLLSDEASYITGATVNVDGGFEMHGGLPDAIYT